MSVCLWAQIVLMATAGVLLGITVGLMVYDGVIWLRNRKKLRPKDNYPWW